MIRTIEALMEQRKALQNRLKQELGDLTQDLAGGFHFGRRKRLHSALEKLADTIGELITVSDREWDAQSNNHSSQVFASLQQKIETLDARYRHFNSLLADFSRLEQRLGQLIDRLADEEEKTEIRKEMQTIREQISPFQYADFEQRFRGGSQAVSAQLKGYVSLFSDRSPVLDLGCGRGEFVSLLGQAGIQAQGVDLSLTMLKKARDADLPCRRGDIVATLRACSENSLGGVFSAQVIEHLDSETLQILVQEAFRALRPGGLLLLETVNPLSLFAFSRIYLLDTTHRSALHPEFMRYLLESCAFAEVEILYGPLPENERLGLVAPQTPESAVINQNADKLNRLLFGSTVYAVKGIKP